MQASIIDGKQISADFKEELKESIKELKDAGHTPSLSVILVGNDPASEVYVHNKQEAFHKMGMSSQLVKLPGDISQKELLSKINELNNEESTDGVLVQLPLPDHIDTNLVIRTIDPDKDVDGFHEQNTGALLNGSPRIIPCTPLGVMYLLHKTGVDLVGAEAVVVGASNIVGKPVAVLLQKAGATVTICNSKTKDLKSHTKRADILVVAVGLPGMIKGDMLKEGCVVIDVGINRLETGKLAGDVDFESSSKVAKAITPVPGGVGPMTIAMLAYNTIVTTKRKLGLEIKSKALYE